MAPRTAAALVLAVLAAAPAAAAGDGDAPAGFRTHTLREAGVSVALPTGWQVLVQRDAVFPGVYANLRRLDRSFAAPLAALASPDSPLKLFAFDRVFWHGRPTTAMLVRATYGRPQGGWAVRMRRALAHAPGRRGPVRIRAVALRAGQALRAEYRVGARDAAVVYVVGSWAGIWAVVFRTPAATLASRRSAFARAAATLEVVEPVGGPLRTHPPPAS